MEMLKAARMKKFHALVLDKYVDFVIREIGEFGKVQVLNIDTEEFGLMQSHREDIYNKAITTLRRIDNICNILDISEELVSGPVSLGIEGKSNIEILEYIDKRISELEERVLNKYSQLNELNSEEENLKSDKKVLRILKSVGIKPGYIEESEFLHTAVGFIDPDDLGNLSSSIKDALNEKFAIIKEQELDEKILIGVMCRKRDEEVVDRILSRHSFDKLELISDMGLNEVEKRLDEIGKRRNEIIEYFNGIRSENGVKILAMRELCEIEKNNQGIKLMLGKTNRVYVLEGWIPGRSILELVERVNKTARGNAILKFYEPGKEDEIPTVMENPSATKPFEPLTGAFGLPAYDEIDPTSIMIVSFPIIYGLMFGDIGHGLMVLIVGSLMIKFMAKGEKGIKSLGVVLMYCGILSMFFGFAYGEMFGQHEFYHDFITEPFGIEPFWINPLEDSEQFLGIAFIVGFIHMSSGIILKFINCITNKKFYHAIASPLMQQWIFIGGAYLIMSRGPEFTEWFNDPMLLLLTLGLPLLGILFSDVIKHIPNGVKVKEIPGLVKAALLELYEIPVGLLANSISYSRIFALALVHIGLFTALFKIAEMFAEIEGIGFIVYLIFVIIGTIVLVCLEGFIVFLHTLRLHYYEWFTKFYEATGIEFRPFRITRLYTCIKSK